MQGFYARLLRAGARFVRAQVLPKDGRAMYIDSAARDPESGLGGVISASR